MNRAMMIFTVVLAVFVALVIATTTPEQAVRGLGQLVFPVILVYWFLHTRRTP